MMDLIANSLSSLFPPFDPMGVQRSNLQQSGILYGDNRMQALLANNYHPSQLQNNALQSLLGVQNYFGNIDIEYLNNRYEVASPAWYKREWDIEFIRLVSWTATEFLAELNKKAE